MDLDDRNEIIKLFANLNERLTAHEKWHDTADKNADNHTELLTILDAVAHTHGAEPTLETIKADPEKYITRANWQGDVEVSDAD